MKTHPSFADRFIKGLLKFILFIACWVLTTNIIIWLNPPAHQSPNESFMVCVELFENPHAILLSELTHDAKLCQKPMADATEENDIDYTAFQSVGNEWELIRYSDKLSDPHVYRYRIENNQVIPLWYSYKDDDTLRNLSGIWALLLTWIIFSVAKRISRNKKPSSEINQ